MNKKTIGISVALFLLIFLFHTRHTLGYPPKEVIETIGQGEVNWTKNVIRATGIGAPNPDAPNLTVARVGSERAAKVDALRNLLEVAKGVRIDSETTVINAVAKNDIVKAKVEGFVSGARIIDKKYFSDGVVEVIVEAPIGG